MRNNSGYTLIELLVVIIIIGILSAIALPSFLNQASKARSSEAKNNLGAILRAQQAYYLENREFAASFPELEIGLERKTTNYTYEVVELSEIGDSEAAGILASPNKNDINAHLGVIEVGGDDNSTFKSVLCEANKPGKEEFTTVSLSEIRTAGLRCGKGLKRVGK